MITKSSLPQAFLVECLSHCLAQPRKWWNSCSCYRPIPKWRQHFHSDSNNLEHSKLLKQFHWNAICNLPSPIDEHDKSYQCHWLVQIGIPHQIRISTWKYKQTKINFQIDLIFLWCARGINLYYTCHRLISHKEFI